MAKSGIATGSFPNDGQGDTLLSGAIKINSNFNEIYSAVGDGSEVTLDLQGFSSSSPLTIVLDGSTLRFSVAGIGTASLSLT